MKDEDRGLIALLCVLVLVLLIGPVLAGGMMGPGMMGWAYGGPGAPAGSGWAWGLGIGLSTLTMLASWAALIVGVVLLVRWLSNRQATSTPGGEPDDPLTILRRRYAGGEIDEATFERMKAELMEGEPVARRPDGVTIRSQFNTRPSNLKP